MATVDIASNSALLAVAEKLAEQNNILSNGSVTIKGADGITPHIGENGNWWIGEVDSGIKAEGTDGKSAYAYAQESGYAGTESEFSQKMACDIPTKVSELTNDSGFITDYTETDPTVPDWAKASTKPTYTAEEVGALPDTTVIPTVPTNVSAFTNDAGYLTTHQSLDGLATEDYVDNQIAAIPTPDVSGQISTHNTNTSAHTDIREQINQLSSEKVNEAQLTSAINTALAEAQASATAVLYTPQTLTTAQQEQARANLGIVGEEQYEFTDSVEDIPADADKSKKYVIDGYIYTYQTKTEEKKHNANDGTGAINKRPNTGGAISVELQSQTGVWTSPLIEIDATQCAPTTDRISESEVIISGLSQIVPAFNSSSIWVWYYKADGTKYYTLKGSQLASVKTDAAITLPLTFQLKDIGTFADSNWANVRYARIVLGISTAGDITENDIAGLVVNMPFFDTTETVSGWYSTGQEFNGDKATQQNTADITTLKLEVANIETEIEEIKKTVEDGDLVNIKTGQVLYAVGDSITYGYGIGGNDYSWVKHVIDRNGYDAANCKNLGQSGLGFCSTSTSGNAITDVMGGTNFSGADIVTVALGINDWKNANALLTDFWAGMEYCFNKIRTDNPYCKIFYILPFNARFLGTFDTFYCLGKTGDSNKERPYAYTLQTFINMIKAKFEEDTFKAFHINVIDMVECPAINRHNITTALIDYTHPSAETQKELGKEIARRIALT